MSGKTKARLEAENAELRSLVAELERDNRGLRSVNEVLLGNTDWDGRRLKITEKAHQAAIDEAIRLQDEKPNIIKAARSESARKAAKNRHALPLPTEVALKEDFKRRQLEEPDKAPTPIYKDMAKQFAGGENFWRRIRTQVLK